MVKRSVFAMSVVLSALVVACGSPFGSAGATPTPSPPPTPTPTPALVVQAATAAVAGKSETILTNSKGFTLYYYTPDKGAGKVTCVAACLQAWPPLLLLPGSQPLGGPGVTGTLGTIASPNGGFQVTYNGCPLYTWTKDTAPGMTTGQNVGKKWFVVTPAVLPPG